MTYNLRMNEGEPARETNTFSDDGVDLTLIRWMLSLTPAVRAADSALRNRRFAECGFEIRIKPFGNIGCRPCGHRGGIVVL